MSKLFINQKNWESFDLSIPCSLFPIPSSYTKSLVTLKNWDHVSYSAIFFITFQQRQIRANAHVSLRIIREKTENKSKIIVIPSSF